MPIPKRPSLSSLALFLAVAIVAPAIPIAHAGPVDDAQRWAGCGDWVLEQFANTVETYRRYAAALEKQAKCKLKLRQPIYIGRDADFWLLSQDGTKIPNHQRGVIGGSGTAEDPFLIAGHEFDGRTPCAPAIHIEKITVHVRISDNWIHDACAQYSIIVSQAANPVTIQWNVLSAVPAGISVISAPSVAVMNNIIENSYAAIDPGTGVSLPQTPARGGTYAAIHVQLSPKAWIHDNEIRHGPTTTAGYRTGIASSLNRDANLAGNHITSALTYGITMDSTDGTANHVYMNVISRADWPLDVGVWVDHRYGQVAVEHNNICNARIPVLGGHVVAGNACW